MSRRRGCEIVAHRTQQKHTLTHTHNRNTTNTTNRTHTTHRQRTQNSHTQQTHNKHTTNTQAKGGGYEDTNYYPRCRIEFMDIDNIHVSQSLSISHRQYPCLSIALDLSSTISMALNRSRSLHVLISRSLDLFIS